MKPDDSNGARFHVGMTIAGRYRVERPIGEGAMGAVALARHVSLDETVAIKFLPPELRRDPAANARLSREAKALARIKSDHVARVLDVGVTLTVGPYMVMEYLEGIDLGDVLENEGPLPVPRAVECVLQVCEALTVAHTAGITHRDIKPQNLFLARHGQFETLKILDFGIAEDSAPVSLSSEAPAAVDAAPASVQPAPASARPPVYGTPSYMAPERVRNDPDADQRSDIWSVGVVLHELVTGRAVFDAPSITETCARIVSNAPLGLERNDALLPPALRSIIARCLERDPARRYQSVEELAAALAPLATMHERFRGRSTGAFSRGLLEAESRRPTTGPASVRASPAAALGWPQATSALRRRLSLSTRWSWLRERSVPTYAAVALASALLAALGASTLGGVHWMAPPREAPAPIRAEPPPAPPRAAPVIEKRMLPLAPSPAAATAFSNPASSNTASGNTTSSDTGTTVNDGATHGSEPRPSQPEAPLPEADAPPANARRPLRARAVRAPPALDAADEAPPHSGPAVSRARTPKGADTTTLLSDPASATKRPAARERAKPVPLQVGGRSADSPSR